MERLLLVKKTDIYDVAWQIDVTQMPIAKVLEIIISETGSDYRVRRTPDRVILECLDQMKKRLRCNCGAYPGNGNCPIHDNYSGSRSQKRS